MLRHLSSAAFAVLILFSGGCNPEPEQGTLVRTADQPSELSRRQQRIHAFVQESGGIHLDSALDRYAFTIEAVPALIRSDSIPIVVVGYVHDVRHGSEGNFEIVIGAQSRSVLIVAESDSAQAYAVLAMRPRRRLLIAAAIHLHSLRLVRQVSVEPATTDAEMEEEVIYSLEEDFGYIARGRLALLTPPDSAVKGISNPSLISPEQPGLPP